MRCKILAALSHSTAVSSVELKNRGAGTCISSHISMRNRSECFTHMVSTVFFIIAHA